MGSENALPSTKHISDQEINERVARKLGEKESYCGKDNCIIPHLKDYCHDIKAAWEVMEKFRNYDFEYINICQRPSGYAVVWTYLGEEDILDVEDIEANTAPMAICLAFLKLP